jgi:hypothetical protein
MLFNFTLLPLQEIQPGNRGDERFLSWFRLTEGQYWIQAGQHALLEYSTYARPFPKYCDYPVVRLYEDVMAILPYVLEPIPAAIAPHIQSASGNKWCAARVSLLENTPDAMNVEQYCKLSSDCLNWWYNRRLDTGYLAPPARIRMWSDETTVHIEWDNREELLNGVPAWTAILGAYHLPRADFIREVRSFHDRLMEQMGERVAQVLTGARPDATIDLRQQHQQRNAPIDRLFAGPATKTDWEQVTAAIGKVERVFFESTMRLHLTAAHRFRSAVREN